MGSILSIVVPVGFELTTIQSVDDSHHFNKCIIECIIYCIHLKLSLDAFEYINHENGNFITMTIKLDMQS